MQPQAPIASVIRFHLTILSGFALLFCILAPAGAGAASPPSPLPPQPPACWEPPLSGTIVELFKAQSSAMLSSSGDAASHFSVLALSSGDFDAAYGAGLLVGWGETGVRPEFSIVTAIGASALIAPFAFLGAAGDQKIGDIFNCPVTSFKELAQQAASRLDADMLAAIAKGHRAGRRLYLVAPHSDSHPAVAWDVGRLAASGRPQALAQVRRILAAMVDREDFLSPEHIPGAAGRIMNEGEELRSTGSGRLFFVAPRDNPRPATARLHYFLVNNGKFDAEESQTPDSLRPEEDTAVGVSQKKGAFRTAFDLFSRARQRRRLFHFSCIPVTTPFVSRYRHEIDSDYSRVLFLRAWRTGRSGEGWRSGLSEPES